MEQQLLYMVRNQPALQRQYNEQQKVARKEKYATNREKEWYGNSKEYQVEWRKQNKVKTRNRKPNQSLHTSPA